MTLIKFNSSEITAAELLLTSCGMLGARALTNPTAVKGGIIGASFSVSLVISKHLISQNPSDKPMLRRAKSIMRVSLACLSALTLATWCGVNFKSDVIKDLAIGGIAFSLALPDLSIGDAVSAIFS